MNETVTQITFTKKVKRYEKCSSSIAGNSQMQQEMMNINDALVVARYFPQQTPDHDNKGQRRKNQFPL